MISRNRLTSAILMAITLIGICAYTGMQTSDKRPKPALATWDAWLQAKIQRPHP